MASTSIQTEPPSDVPSKPSRRKSSPEDFYKLFKKNFNPSASTALQEIDKLPKHTRDENIKSLKEITVENAGLGQKQMFNHCIIGNRIKCLKEDYKLKNKDFNELLKLYGGKLFGMGMRNFYVRLHDFAMKYNNIMYVNISACGGITNLYHKWAALKKMVKNEADFWK